MQISGKITPCLWFDNQAEEAARFYTSIFKNSKINITTHYGEAGKDIHGKLPGSVMTVEFELDGYTFCALNGGPLFKFTEAISFQINCENQAEVDYFWDKLTQGGDESAQQCGWLKDKFGLSWQVVPKDWFEMMADPNSERSQRAFIAMMQMKKLDINALKMAYEG